MCQQLQHRQMKFPSQAKHDWFQVEGRIGGVKSEHAIRTQMPQVGLHGFFGEQVDRNLVATERVDYQNIKRLQFAASGFGLHGQSCVPEDDLKLGWAILQKSKQGMRTLLQPENRWIDFIKSYVVTGPSVGRECTRSEANYSEAHWCACGEVPLRMTIEEDTDATAVPVVKRWTQIVYSPPVLGPLIRARCRWYLASKVKVEPSVRVCEAATTTGGTLSVSELKSSAWMR
jgi:hypothetical protein